MNWVKKLLCDFKNPVAFGHSELWQLLVTKLSIMNNTERIWLL